LLFFPALCIGTTYLIYFISYFINDVQEDDTTAEEFIEKPSTCETEDFSNGEKAAKIMVKATSHILLHRPLLTMDTES
jgi:hypothetical protein